MYVLAVEFGACPNTSDAELPKKIATVKVFVSKLLHIKFHSSILINVEIARCVPVNKKMRASKHGHQIPVTCRPGIVRPLALLLRSVRSHLSRRPNTDPLSAY